VLSADVGEQGLEVLAASLRRSIEANGVPVSVGWALVSGDEGTQRLLDRADAAMYADKRRRSAAAAGAEREPVQGRATVRGNLLAGELG
jgi:GGDEF domain-containing protein